MAITTVQIHVTSVAGNGEYAGKVIKGWETYSIHIKGESVTKKRLWTAWLETPSTLKATDVVELIGELGTKATEFTKDGNTYKTVEHTLNKARYNIIKLGDPSKTVAAETSQLGESPF